MRSLNVLSNGRLVGLLTEDNNLWQFRYDAQWAGDPKTFDLSPHLPRRAPAPIVDGASERPVQWYFDNLLPEEGLRTAVSREARIAEADAFGLLAYLGSESAGSLVLQDPGADPAPAPGSQDLSDEALSQRICVLPKVTLQHSAPKRMSLAGAQHKLLVIYSGDRIYEPVGATPSTHILKPDHRDKDAYPSSVINEYAMMKLAASLKLDVPRVYRRYCPEPVYIVERFDRVVHGALPQEAHRTERLQLIDTCQLLNKDRLFKYSAASLDTLKSVIAHCRSRGPARLALFRWLAFNLLIGNNDNHIKNISYLIDDEGVRLAPFYDLLSTASYRTRAYARSGPHWPTVDLAIALPKQPRFEDVTRAGLLDAGAALGLPAQVCSRELDAMLRSIEPNLDQLIERIGQENEHLPEPCRPFLGGEMQLLRTIRHVVVAEMVKKLKG